MHDPLALTCGCPVQCIDGGMSVGMVTATDSMDSPGDFTEVNYFISGGTVF